MAGSPNTSGGSTRSEAQLRARVNGRTLTFDRESGEVLKGPRPMVGKYIAANQLERIERSSSYYGHLFLADSVDTRRLKEAEFALMEHRAEKGRITLIEQMTISFNGHSARVVDLTESAVTLAIGNVERKFSRERVEQEATVDYTAPAPQPEMKGIWDDAPQVNPDLLEGGTGSQQKYEGSVEIDIDDLAAKVAAKMHDDTFMEALADRIVKRLGNTLDDSGA